jgi:hypothetical protein
VQRVGSAPYRRDVVLQTNYVTLALRHPAAQAVPDDPAQIDQYVVARVEAIARPPVYDQGAQQGNQGQHKVAWVAIWTALQRMIGQKLSDAAATMNDIIAVSGVHLVADNPGVMVVGGASSPAVADALIVQAHNYLVSKQADNPSWPSNDPDQLKGKGERALVGPLQTWQAASPADVPPTDVIPFLDTNLRGLFDTTGRAGPEKLDAAQRARAELRIHNPTLFATYTTQIDQWLQSRIV